MMLDKPRYLASSFAFVIPVQDSTGGLGSFGMLLPLVGIFIVFYLFIIRPQKKREDKRKAMIASVRKDDKVVTAGGIHGHVTKVDDTSVLLEVATNTKLRVEKSAIANVTPR